MFSVDGTAEEDDGVAVVKDDLCRALLLNSQAPPERLGLATSGACYQVLSALPGVPTTLADQLKWVDGDRSTWSSGIDGALVLAPPHRVSTSHEADCLTASCRHYGPTTRHRLLRLRRRLSSSTPRVRRRLNR